MSRLVIGAALLLLLYETFAREWVLSIVTIAVVALLVTNEPTIRREFSDVVHGR